MLRICKTFIRDFFDQNPLSQLGIVVFKDGIAEKLTDLSGSPEAQIKRLDQGQLGGCGVSGVGCWVGEGVNVKAEG